MREEDVVALIDTLNLLENQHVVNGSTALYYGDLANIYGSVRDQATPGTPAWSLVLPIYGPEKVIRAQLEYARDKFARVPGMRFVEGEAAAHAAVGRGAATCTSSQLRHSESRHLLDARALAG